MQEYPVIPGQLPESSWRGTAGWRPCFFANNDEHTIPRTKKRHGEVLHKAGKTIHEERHDYAKEKGADEKGKGDADERLTSRCPLYAGIHGTGVFTKEKFRNDLTAYACYSYLGKT